MIVLVKPSNSKDIWISSCNFLSSKFGLLRVFRSVDFYCTASSKSNLFYLTLCAEHIILHSFQEPNFYRYTDLNKDTILLSPGQRYAQKVINSSSIVKGMNSGILKLWGLTKDCFSHCHGLTARQRKK